MPPQGILLQPQLPGLAEVANDDNCDATVIESDDDTDGTEIESDNQICEDDAWEDEAEGEENGELATRGNNQETIDGRIALNDGLFRDAIKQPKMPQTQLAIADLIRHYDKGTRRSSRRSHGRVDGLEHLCKFPARVYGFHTEMIQLLAPAPSAVGGNETDEMQSLHGIAFCLIRLNTSILVARDNAHQNNDYSIFSSKEFSYMNSLITVDEYERWHTTSTISMDGEQETRLVEYINTFSTEQIIQRIQDPKALPYMPKLFESRLGIWETWKGQRKMLENDPDFVIPPQYKAVGKAEYANICVYNYRTSRQIIRNLYTITLQLRKHTITACSSKILDDTSIRQLKAKMTALQPGFQETCQELGYPREQLVWDTEPWW
jgi:hypothetical protein